jgi:hypothetical protein
MMWTRLLLTVYLVLFILSVQAQSDEPPPITPENIENVAIVAHITPEDFGLTDATINQFKFHPKNNTLLIAMQNSFSNRRSALLGVYNLDTYEAHVLLVDDTFRSLGFRASDLYFSPDMSLVISSDSSRTFVVWNIETNQFLFTGSPSGQSLVTSDNDFLLVLTGTYPQVAHVWDIDAKQEIDRRQFTCFVAWIDGSNLVCSDVVNNRQRIQVFEFPSFNLIDEQISDFEVTPRNNPSGSIVTPDGRRVTSFTNNMYEIYEIETRQVIASVETTRPTSRYDTNNEGDIIFYWSDDALVFRNPLANTNLLTLLQPQYGFVNRFAETGNYFITLEQQTNQLDLYAISDCYLTSDRTVNLRSGPGTDFDNPAIMQAGERLAVDGQSPDGIYTWWHLSVGYWVRDDVVTEAGDNCDGVEMVD